MAAVKLQCPNCDRRIGIPDHAEGKRIKCPHCLSLYRVISGSLVADSPAAAASPRQPQTARAFPAGPVAIAAGAGALVIGAVIVLIVLMRGGRPEGIEILADAASDSPASAAPAAAAATPARRDAPAGLLRTIPIDAAPPEGHWHGGGIAAIGDANGDGHTDFVVSAATHHMGALTAYSGRDGSLLWNVEGHATPRDGEGQGFFIREFVAIHDVNGDGVRDLFVREDYLKRGFRILSGRDGSILLDRPAPPTPQHLTGPTRNLSEEAREELHRFQLDAQHAAALPDRLQDITGDGTPDLIRLHRTVDRESSAHQLEWRAYSGRDFSLIDYRTDLLPDELSQRPEWRLAEFSAPGAETPDYLVETLGPDLDRWIVLSGSDLSIIRQIERPRRQIISDIRLATPGDANGDGVPDIAVAEKRNASGNHHMSHLSLFCGSSGERIWEIRGDAVPGVLTTMEIRMPGDPHDGEKWTDAGFSTALRALPDLNGDGVGELAATVNAAHMYSRAILIICGATGEPLARISLPENQGDLLATQVIPLESVDGAGRRGLLTNARTRDGRNHLALFSLPNLR